MPTSGQPLPLARISYSRGEPITSTEVSEFADAVTFVAVFCRRCVRVCAANPRSRLARIADRRSVRPTGRRHRLRRPVTRSTHVPVSAGARPGAAARLHHLAREWLGSEQSESPLARLRSGAIPPVNLGHDARRPERRLGLRALRQYRRRDLARANTWLDPVAGLLSQETPR